MNNAVSFDNFLESCQRLLYYGAYCTIPTMSYHDRPCIFLLTLKMSRLSLLVLVLMFLGCSSKSERGYYWVGTQSRGLAQDTCYFRQNTTTRNDSIILECNFGEGQSQFFVFSAKDKANAYTNGRLTNRDLYLGNKLIHKASKTIFTFAADTVVIAGSERVPLYKYFYEEPYTYDAGCNYYWCPDIGIVYFSSTAWGNSYRLYTNDAKTDSTITAVVDVIKSWNTSRNAP